MTLQDEYDFFQNLLDIIDNYDHNAYIYILDEMKTISSNINFNNKLTENNKFCLADTLYSHDGNYFFEFTEDGYFVSLEAYVPKSDLREFFEINIHKTNDTERKIITQQPLSIIADTNLEEKFKGKLTWIPIEYAKLIMFMLSMFCIIFKLIK